jgi:hypothetical protein
MHTYIPEAKQAESGRTLGPEQIGLAQGAVEAGMRTGTINDSGERAAAVAGKGHQSQNLRLTVILFFSYGSARQRSLSRVSFSSGTGTARRSHFLLKI